MATKILVFDPDFSDGVAHTERQLDVYLNDGYQILASHSTATSAVVRPPDDRDRGVPAQHLITLILHRNCARGHRALARWGMALASFPFP